MPKPPVETPPVALVFARPPLTMTVPEAAIELGLSRSQLERILKSGALTAFVFVPGGERRISYEALQNYVRGLQASQTSLR